MNIDELENCDKLIRILYQNRNRMMTWKEVYTQADVSRGSADERYSIIEADGYIEFVGKGSGSFDDSYIGITKQGLSWFARTNYVNEFNERNKPPQSFVNNGIYNENKGTQGDVMMVSTTGKRNSTKVKEGKAEDNKVLRFVSENLTAILVTIVGTILSAILLRYFNLI